MKIAVPKERRPHEARVAASPDTVKKLVALGATVAVETGAGHGADLPDEVFGEAGATIAPDAAATYADADIVFKIQRPLGPGEGELDEVSLIKPGAVLIGLLAPRKKSADLEAYAKGEITAFALELLPRISRAQSMDVLSSQSNLAGYKAVLDAAAEYHRAFPMMMTAAGTVAPARVFVLGAGVAGLQAIATAKRLGAVVTATDVRAAVAEQVESLGAKFVKPATEESGEGEGGYAREVSAEYQKKQAELVHETLKKQDIAICTALIPGRQAPTLISADMVGDMKPGSIIVDLAVEQGGNCELSEPGRIVEVGGVRIIGHRNVPSRLATDASFLFARNVLNFVTPLIDADSGALAIDWEDEIVKGCLITTGGKVVHPSLAD